MTKIANSPCYLEAGMNEGQRDRSCCSLCLSDSRCEFWERVGDECSLKRNFMAYSPSSLLESPVTNDVAAEGAHGSSGQGKAQLATDAGIDLYAAAARTGAKNWQHVSTLRALHQTK